ncbi:MAG: carboxynorspermidine decarboxylase [Selenomonadaceae bacterium]|nr:carboxynorspermidine decarboxylase [Selenomonadaceae bacterium]
MNNFNFKQFNFSLIKTPSYVISESLLRHNLEILSRLQNETGVKVLLAQKCFSMYYFYPLISKYLTGTAASGLFEAQLANEYFNGENHVFAPAYKDNEIEKIASMCEHIIFNSFRQVEKFAPVVKQNNHQVGLRINPEHSTQTHAIYDPCAPKSRLGVRLAEFQNVAKSKPELVDMLDGLHMHTLCEQNSDALKETVDVLIKNFDQWLHKIKWINLGGGHHITKPDYDIERLKRVIKRLQDNYGVTVYLEPGEAVAMNAGFLVSTVLEIQESIDNISNVIIDASAACHMPDVIEMPYRPDVIGDVPDGKYKYRLGSMTCLAGDVIGEYAFNEPLNEGDKIIFTDMAIYTMVKNNTFNGMPLPSIIAVDESGNINIVREFGYEDFKQRL